MTGKCLPNRLAHVTMYCFKLGIFKNSEYDQEIPQSQTADNPVALRGRAAQPSQGTRKTNKQSNQLSLPHQDDCNTRMDIK